MTTFATFILTFNRPSTLRDTISVVLAQSAQPDYVVVIDNGDSDETRAVVGEYPDIGYVSTGQNLGSAGGVAFGLEHLYDAGFDWIHSVDDDNPPSTNDTIERLRALIERHPESDVGAVGASGTRWDWSRGQHARIPDAELDGDLDVDTIGGGQHLVVRRTAIDAVGLPEKEFFFGFYDPLYCLRLRQAGLRLLVDGQLMHDYRRIWHRLDLEPKRSIRPRDPLHATWRRYYVSRNYIFRMRQTFGRPDLARREAARALLRSAASWGNGPRYGFAYSRLQLRGVLDGYRGQLGRRVEPVQKPP